MEAATITAVATVCGAVGGSLVTAFVNVWMGKGKRQQEIQALVYSENAGMRDELSYLRREVRQRQHDCDDVKRSHTECERKLALLSLEVATLRGTR